MHICNYQPDLERMDVVIHTVANSVGSAQPKLLIVLVGQNPASEKYISLKLKLCDKLGIHTQLLRLSEEKSDDELGELFSAEVNSSKVKSCILQLPLPKKSLNFLIKLVPKEKDVDFINADLVSNYTQGKFNQATPVVRAFLHFVNYHASNTDQPTPDPDEFSFDSQLVRALPKLQNKKTIILGNGKLVGRPIARLLDSMKLSVEINEKYIKGDKIYSDYLILGTGVPKLVSGADISPGCNVLDYGTTPVEGKLVGDLDLAPAKDHLGIVSVSPGGIGPVVLRYLLMNHLSI